MNYLTQKVEAITKWDHFKARRAAVIKGYIAFKRVKITVSQISVLVCINKML